MWCGQKFNLILRSFMLSLNLLVMLMGVLVTCAGASLLITEYLYNARSWHQVSIVSYLLLTAGMITITVSFLACCGSLVSSKCLLTMFVIKTGTIIVGQLAFGLLLYFKVRIQFHVTLCGFGLLSIYVG